MKQAAAYTSNRDELRQVAFARLREQVLIKRRDI
jgi:hypothetical protein